MILILNKMVRVTRQTKQKDSILKEISKINEFFTAEEFFNQIQKKEVGVSLATVYRVLKQLKKEKKIFSYTCNGRAIYSNVRRSHCHFVCEESGKVIHFDIDSLDFLKDKIPGTISSFQIEVKGKCTNCCKLK